MNTPWQVVLATQGKVVIGRSPRKKTCSYYYTVLCGDGQVKVSQLYWGENVIELFHSDLQDGLAAVNKLLKPCKDLDDTH